MLPSLHCIKYLLIIIFQIYVSLYCSLSLENDMELLLQWLETIQNIHIYTYFNSDWVCPCITSKDVKSSTLIYLTKLSFTKKTVFV